MRTRCPGTTRQSLREHSPGEVGKASAPLGAALWLQGPCPGVQSPGSSWSPPGSTLATNEPPTPGSIRLPSCSSWASPSDVPTLLPLRRTDQQHGGLLPGSARSSLGTAVTQAFRLGSSSPGRGFSPTDDCHRLRPLPSSWQPEVPTTVPAGDSFPGGNKGGQPCSFLSARAPGLICQPFGQCLLQGLVTSPTSPGKAPRLLDISGQRQLSSVQGGEELAPRAGHPVPALLPLAPSRPPERPGPTACPGEGLESSPGLLPPPHTPLGWALPSAQLQAARAASSSCTRDQPLQADLAPAGQMPPAPTPGLLPRFQDQGWRAEQMPSQPTCFPGTAEGKKRGAHWDSTCS